MGPKRSIVGGGLVRIALTGDVVPMRPLPPGPTPSDEVYGLLRGADLAVGNLDMALAHGGAPVEKPIVRRADPALAPGLAALGFGALSLANNHALDYGWAGLNDTRRALTEAGISTVGAGQDLDAAARPAIFERQGRRVGVIAFSCLTPGSLAAGPDRPGIAAIRIDTAYQVDPWHQIEEPGDPAAITIRTSARPEDRAYAVTAVQSLARRCDLTIVSLHWGFGSGRTLAEYQRPLAHALIGAGADVIHGHHPHAVQAVETHRGRLILFGLGTFMAQQLFEDAGPKARAVRATMSRSGLVAMISADSTGLRTTLYRTTLGPDHTPVPDDPFSVDDFEGS